MIRVRDITRLGSPESLGILKIESLIVWDYKVQDGKLRLIWEPEKGTQDYDKVSWKEIIDYLSTESCSESAEIVPETGGESFKSVEQEDGFINFRLK